MKISFNFCEVFPTCECLSFLDQWSLLNHYSLCNRSLPTYLLDSLLDDCPDPAFITMGCEPCRLVHRAQIELCPPSPFVPSPCYLHVLLPWWPVPGHWFALCDPSRSRSYTRSRPSHPDARHSNQQCPLKKSPSW